MTISEAAKPCPDCGTDKPLSAFPVAKKRSDGRATYCRECMLVRSRASYRSRVAAAGKTVRQPEDLPDDHKRCHDCGSVKPFVEFPRNKRVKDGRHPYCKPCHNARGKESKTRLYGGSRPYHLTARYGLERGEDEEMLLDQGGLCPICREAPAEHVDHDHVTGEVRGLLCFNCNGGLGQFRDRVDIMTNAINYLERSRDTTWQRVLVRMDVFQRTSPQRGAASLPSSELQHLICSRRS